jgi:hydrogenase/urease accessory protein HupE
VRPFVGLLAVLVCAVAPLRAHDPGLSTSEVVVTRDQISATVGYAPNDVRTLLPADAHAPASTWDAAEFDVLKPFLLKLAPGLIEVRGAAGVLAWTDVSVSLASGNSVLFQLARPRSADARLSIRFPGLARLPFGHRDYLSVVDEQGKTVLEKLVGVTDPDATFDLPVPSAGAGGREDSPEEPEPTFWGFLKLGIAHIWTGYDHLLFLFGLLVVCRSFRSIVGIISCFTIAHSITLALATLNVVHLPSRVVEPMIAASIFYVGIENLVRKGAEPKGRWALTFAFGLIHGFGFASVLRELGVGSNGRGLAMPLFTFNLGVEVGQITIAAIVLPIVWQLRKNPAFVRRGVPILSGLVAAAGLYWFLERTLF